MTDWLLLRLPPVEDGPVSWALADAAGQLMSLPSSDTGAGLHTVSVGRRIALLVPGADVVHLHAVVPMGSEARALQLVPFALEDQLSQDVDQLHFAIGSRDATSGTVPVAVMERVRMQQWLARATALQLTPQAVFAESQLVPALPGHVTMVVADDQLVVRSDGAQPLLLPAGDPALALDMVLGDQVEASSVHLAVYSTPVDWARHGPTVETLRESVASFKVQLNSGGLLALYAKGLAHTTPINLLQGDFRPKSQAKVSWQQWRWVAALACALLLLHGAGSWWQLRQLRKDVAETQAQITQLYESTFPGQRAGREPRRAMEKRLAAVASGGTQQGELLHLLAAVSAATQNVPVAKLDSFSFKPGQLQLKLAAPDASTLELYSQALRASGYDAQVTSGTNRDGRYEGQIELRNPGS